MLRLPPSTSLYGQARAFSASLPRFKKKTPASKHGSLIFVRSIRMKNNKYFTAKAEREEEELLEKLQLQLAHAKKRLAEDEAKRKTSNDPLRRTSKASLTPEPAATPLDKHTSSLWDGVVDKDDQAKLAAYGIKTMDQLQEAYREADADLNRPPYPSVQRLKPRLRLAYELYHSIPQKLAAQRRKPQQK